MTSYVSKTLNNVKAGFVYCPEGKSATGGGWAQAGGKVVTSGPTGANGRPLGWYVEFDANVKNAQIYVICI